MLNLEKNTYVSYSIELFYSVCGTKRSCRERTNVHSYENDWERRIIMLI
jgi:hypothetical protein